MNKTLFLNENDNYLNSINMKNENNIVNNNNSKDNNGNDNIVLHSININNPLKKEKLLIDELTIQNDIFNFGDSIINQSLFYPENDILDNQILKLNDSNILIDEFFK